MLENKQGNLSQITSKNSTIHIIRKSAFIQAYIQQYQADKMQQ